MDPTEEKYTSKEPPPGFSKTSESTKAGERYHRDIKITKNAIVVYTI